MATESTLNYDSLIELQAPSQFIIALTCTNFFILCVCS